MRIFSIRTAELVRPSARLPLSFGCGRERRSADFVGGFVRCGGGEGSSTASSDTDRRGAAGLRLPLRTTDDFDRPITDLVTAGLLSFDLRFKNVDKLPRAAPPSGLSRGLTSAPIARIAPDERGCGGGPSSALARCATGCWSDARGDGIHSQFFLMWPEEFLPKDFFFFFFLKDFVRLSLRLR